MAVDLVGISIDKCPDDKHLNKYVRGKVCAAGTDKWQDLGIELMGQYAVYVLNEIKANSNDNVECCSRMFTEWRKRTPRASWKQLIEALKEVELTELASELERLLQPTKLEEQSALVTSERQQSLKRFKAHSRPSRKALLPFVPQLAPSWYELGIMLLDEKDVRRLTKIEANSGGDKQRCCLVMLQYWIDTHPEATWLNLVTALKSPGVDLPAVASDMEKSFTVSTSTSDHDSRDSDSMKAHLSPSIKALLPFVPQLAPKWYELGIMLIEEIDLVMIKAKHGGDKQRCCLAMLQYWMEGYSEPTWHFLVTALKSPSVDLPAVASTIERKFTEDLTCPVCFRLYKNPKFLPCHHSYCEECLEKMQVQSKITCPECRYEAIVPKGGVKNLPPNFYINRRMDKLGLKHGEEDELKCSKCVENKPAVAYCDCTSNLCQFCFENHSSHGTVSLINQRSNKSVTIEPKAMALMCREHDLELLLFCETCEQLVCKHCVAKGHNGHDYANARMKVCKCQIKLEKVSTSAEEVAKNVLEVQDTTDETKEKDQEHQTKSEAKLMLGIEQLSESSKIEELIDINDVKITSKILRYGSYYVGYEAVYCGKQYIAKKEHSQNNFSKKLMKHEWKLLAHLNHPHITQQLAMLDKPKSTPVLLMEQMWMSLSEFLTNKHSHHDKISILRDAACGLHHIHEKDIVHCDLTADNILLTENLTAKLADFGRATRGQQIFLKYLPENLDHVPPEIFEPYSRASCSTKVDVFSFGCVIIHTFIEECPIPDFDKLVETSEVGKYKKHSEVERRSICLKKLKNNCNSTKLHDVVLKCLQDNPDCRPTAATLLSLLEDQLAAIVPYKYVENICPEVSLKSMRHTTSLNMLLEKRLRLLTALNVSGYNITDQGVDMIAAVLLETVSLTKLDLSNTMLSSVKATKINSSLKNIKSLKVLNINNNDIDDGAADSIAAVVHNNSFIEEINLSHNKMTYNGVLNIANALSESIKIFDISSNFIASDNIADLATALSKCPVLQQLNISGNSLRLTEMLTIAQSFRLHPTLQSLNLSGNAISFSSAAEFIIDITLSVNQTLVKLNVCGRNIRPRRIDYLSAPSTENSSATFPLQNLYSLQRSSLDTQTSFIKVVEACPILSEEIISYYADHLGGVFYNKHHNFAIVIPPGAVTQGDCVEIQGTANYCGPYTIPDGLYPISSYFWLSANYKFESPVYLIMNHYAKIRSLEDISNLHVLQSAACDSNDVNKELMMNRISDGVYFDYSIGYSVLVTNHFCSYCQAKGDEVIPEYLLACYCTYDELSSESLIAEVCFCPPNSECKKVIIKQCEKRNTQIQHSETFVVGNEEELCISFIDKSNVHNNEWILSQRGKLTITHLRDFKYWEIFHGLTIEQIREREDSFDYPPRLQIKCEQIDVSKSLFSSFVVSKRNKNMETAPIAQFSLVKKILDIQLGVLTASTTYTAYLQHQSQESSLHHDNLQSSHVKMKRKKRKHTHSGSKIDMKLKERPTHQILCRVGRYFAADWRIIGFELLKPEDVKNIECTTKPNDVKCLDMLIRWLEIDSKASYSKLIEGLHKHELHRSAEKIKNKIIKWLYI